MATNEQGVVSTAQSAELHSLFHSQKQGILQSLEEQSSTSITDISKRISSLRTLVDSFGEGLPKYDRGRYASQITELESKVAILRAKEKPKSRFAFTKPKSSPSPGAGQSRASPTIPPPTLSQATSNVLSLTVSSSDDVRRAPDSTSASTMHTISSLTDTLVRPELAPGTGAYTLSLSHLYRCVIDLCPPHVADITKPTLTTLHAKGLEQCIMVAPVLPGSAMLSEMVDCLVIVGAQQVCVPSFFSFHFPGVVRSLKSFVEQFRIHSSTNTQVLLNVASLPVIEHCTNLAFGAYPPFLLSTQPVYESKHTHVQDFDWVRGGQSPNWSLLSKDEASALFTQEMASRLYNVREKDEKLVMEWTKRLRSRLSIHNLI
ncbi:Tubulin folding cofactor C, putative [Cryptococcus gattii WM276]|uniref:Tubulin folding cofactor C, putative n=2 Tax=Cryptococcus gattii TaxID=37769 RepID=E6QY72_CRYGW|nr:Tubulin folding cofactor C, putative [Cryptococcus gattii WM276]ADV19801.1 Tubulin folding cofactor C, putative [Cryptococcus gattii WM276]KIR79616.1 tubulin folding cofactor C [Cryptococcus gattii EJB2]